MLGGRKGAIDGVNGICYEEPFIELKIIRGDAEEGIEEFACLENGEVRICLR